jgi:uncharacterized RDD family membrane protein YckC
MQDDKLQPGSQPDLLHEEYTIDTPENVTFGYSVAGIGSRFIGALIDTSLLALLLLLLNLAITLALAWLGDSAPPPAFDEEPEPGWVAGLLIAIYALINFGLIWGYYLVFELMWNGQSPGKRLARTQVVQTNGSPAGFTDIAIRNLVRIVDFMPVAYGVGLVVMFSNRRSRRLGDFAANTLVIRQRDQVKLADLGYSSTVPHSGAAAGPSPEQLARFPNLREITAGDYQLMRDVLARRAQGSVDTSLLRRVAVAMAARSGAAAPPEDVLSTRKFLSDLIDAYRASRR